GPLMSRQAAEPRWPTLIAREASRAEYVHARPIHHIASEKQDFRIGIFQIDFVQVVVAVVSQICNIALLTGDTAHNIHCRVSVHAVISQVDGGVFPACAPRSWSLRCRGRRNGEFGNCVTLWTLSHFYQHGAQMAHSPAQSNPIFVLRVAYRQPAVELSVAGRCRVAKGCERRISKHLRPGIPRTVGLSVVSRYDDAFERSKREGEY